MYILNGLNVSPHIEYKFKSLADDPVDRSDLCNLMFGMNSAKRHRVFKFLFTVHDPMLPLPSQKLAPDNKVDHFFSHLLTVFPTSYKYVGDLSSDDQDASF